MQKFMDIVCRQGGIRPVRGRRRRDRQGAARARRLARRHGVLARGVADAAASGHREPRRAHPHGAGLRHPVRRRRQPLPERHRRGSRARAHALARGRRAGRAAQHRRRRRRQGRRRPRARRRQGRQHAERLQAHLPGRRPRSRTRSPPSRRKVYGADGVEFLPEAAGQARSASPSSATATCRSAWPRRTSRSRTIRLVQGAPTRLHGADPRPPRLHGCRAS